MFVFVCLLLELEKLGNLGKPLDNTGAGPGKCTCILAAAKIYVPYFLRRTAKRTGGFGGFAPNCRRPPPPVGPERGRGGGLAAGAALRHFAISNA